MAHGALHSTSQISTSAYWWRLEALTALEFKCLILGCWPRPGSFPFHTIGQFLKAQGGDG